MAEFIQYDDFFEPGLPDKFREYLKTLGIIAQQETDAIISNVQKAARGVTNELTASNIKAQENLTKVIGESKKRIEELNSVEKERLRIEKEFETLQAKLANANTSESARNEKVKQSLQKANEERRATAKLIDSEIGSYKRISLELQKNIKDYKNLSEAQRNNAAVGGKLLTTIQGQQRQLKGMDATMGNFQRNVGNYKSALEGLPGPIGGAVSSSERLLGSVAKLGPIGASVAGILASLAAPLLAFFKKSEDGAEMWERKMAGLKASWNVLVGEFIKGGRKMTESFEDTERKSAFWQKLMTGLGAIGGPAIRARFEMIGIGMDSANKAAQAYTKTIQELEDLERSMIVPRAEANMQIAAAKLLYEDESKSLKVRMQALRESLLLEQQTTQKELEHQIAVTQNIRIINEEKRKAGQLRDEDDRKLQESLAKEIDLRTESLIKQRKVQSTLNAAEDAEITKQMGLMGDLTDKYIKLQEQISAANKLGFVDRAAQLTKEAKAIEDLMNKYNDFNASLERADQIRINRSKNGFVAATEQIEAERKLLEIDTEMNKQFQANAAFLTGISAEELAAETAKIVENIDKLNDAYRDLAQSGFDLFTSLMDYSTQMAEIEVENHNKVIESLENKLQTESELKDQGKANDYDRLVAQLGEEQKLRDEAQKKYETYQKRQAQLKFLETQANLGLSVAEAFAAGAGEGPAGWIIAIAAAASLISAFVSMQSQIKSIGAYAEGTEYVNGPGTSKSDSIPARLSKGERVVPADTNAQLGGIDNDRLPEIYKFYKYNMLRGEGAVYTGNELLAELRRGRMVNEKILRRAEQQVQMIQLSDGSVMVKDGMKTQVIHLK